MTDMQWLLLIAAMFATFLPGSIVLLAFKVRGMITVTVTTPPVTVNQAPITVQAPTALLPEKVEQILNELNEKLRPEKPTLSPEEQEVAITKIVQEARLVGEQFASNNAANGHAVTDAEKQREAMRYIKQRIEALNIQSDYAVLAGQLESEVRKAKETKS